MSCLQAQPTTCPGPARRTGTGPTTVRHRADKEIPLKNLLAAVITAALIFSLPVATSAQQQAASEAAQARTDIKPPKTWKGPIFGIGAGLGFFYATVQASWAGISEDSAIFGHLPIRARLGYGLSDSAVLYGVVGSERLLDDRFSDDPMTPLYGALGMMYRSRRDSSFYGFGAIGADFGGEGGNRAFLIRGGSGIEIHEHLSLEGAATVRFGSEGGVSFSLSYFDLTFNYHFY